MPHLPNEVLNPPKVVPHLPNRLLILPKKVLSLPKKVLWGSKSFRFLQILSAANQQYAGARTPDRQQAAGIAAASLLQNSANAMRSDEDSLRSLTGITKFVSFRKVLRNSKLLIFHKFCMRLH